MSIERVLKIQNVGRFASLTSRGDVQFRRLTVIYGANGHGKTTIAGLLRSLRTGRPEFVNERAMLGRTGDPVVELRLSGGNATFKNGNWNKTAPEIEIFDSTFVSDNVYTGEHVDPEHRKNLYEIVVGASAVALAQRVDQIDVEGRSTAKQIASLEDRLGVFIQRPFSIDEFLGLKPEEELDEKIKDATTRLNALRKAKEILARRELDALDVPEVPKRVLEALKPATQKISAQTEQQVRQHIQGRLDGRGEQWLAQGLEYLRPDHECPFCTQTTERLELVALFRDYFSKAYRERGIEVERAINELEQTFGETFLGRVQKLLLENDARIQGWSDLADLSYAHCSFDNLESRWRHLRDLLRITLKARLANSAQADSIDPKLEAARRDYDDAAAAFRRMNDSIARANDEIARLKQQAASANEEDLESELRRLRNMQIRERVEVSKVCNDLQAVRAKKKALEEEKKEKRRELEALAEGVLAQYETAINDLLRKFGANFTITGTKPSFQGGKASSTYQISINNKAIDLGDSATPRGTPCFRTALSSGDKSTLALAFFLASLSCDPALPNKIIVLDDPLTSLDFFRVACTQQEIRSLAEKAAQVVVLSHDPYFLKRVYDSHIGAPVKAMHIVRDGQSHELQEWNIDRYCLAEAHQDYFALRTFLEEGASNSPELRAVGRAIRPYLEGAMRHRFPEQFGAGEWLGDFIGQIRAATNGPLLPLKGKLAELDALNEYSKTFHHSGEQALPAVPNEDELRTYVSRAIQFVQG